MSWFIYVTGPPPARPLVSGPHLGPPQVLGPPPPSLQPIPGLPPPRPPDMTRPPPPHMWSAPGPPPPFHTFPPGPRPGPFVPEQGGVRMIMVPKVDPVIVNINSEGKCAVFYLARTHVKMYDFANEANEFSYFQF